MKTKFLLCGIRTCVLAGLLMAAAIDPSASTVASERRASGAGSVRIDRDRNHDEAIGTFEFEVAKVGSRITGRMEYAAEDHGERSATYPHVIVRMDVIEEASFRARRVTFSGDGWMQGETVKVFVEARDGATEDDVDVFTITCSDESGVVYEATGNVFIGSIQIPSGS